MIGVVMIVVSEGMHRQLVEWLCPIWETCACVEQAGTLHQRLAGNVSALVCCLPSCLAVRLCAVFVYLSAGIGREPVDF